MNKEQIKHWCDVLRELATGIFMVAGGKNLYLYSSKQDVDWVILGIAGGIFILFHAIIHLILSVLED